MVSEYNSPFQAPQTTSEHRSFDGKVQIQGVFVLILSGLAILLGAVNILGLLLMVGEVSELDLAYSVGRMMGSGLMLCIQIFFFLTGVKMVKGTIGLKAYRSTAILLCIPCITSLVVCGIPIGIWMGLTQRNEDFKEAFAARDPL